MFILIMVRETISYRLSSLEKLLDKQISK